MFFLSFTHIDVFSQTKWKISQNPFSLHSPPGVSKIPSLWVNDRFSGNNLVQGKSLTRLFVKMSNLSVSGRIRYSSCIGEIFAEFERCRSHTHSQLWISEIFGLYFANPVQSRQRYPSKCKYGAIWFSAFSLLKSSVIKIPLISVQRRIYD